MRLDGAKKSQDACQALISWEDAGPAMLDLGLLLSSFVFRACREVAHSPTVAGPQAGRLPSEKGPQRGSTKRLGASRAISLGLRSCTRGSRTAKEGRQAGQSMAEAWQRQGEVGRKNIMSEPNGEIQTGRECPSSSPVVPWRRILRTSAGRVATPSPDDKPSAAILTACANDSPRIVMPSPSVVPGRGDGDIKGLLRRVPKIR